MIAEAGLGPDHWPVTADGVAAHLGRISGGTDLLQHLQATGICDPELGLDASPKGLASFFQVGWRRQKVGCTRAILGVFVSMEFSRLMFQNIG